MDHILKSHLKTLTFRNGSLRNHDCFNICFQATIRVYSDVVNGLLLIDFKRKQWEPTIAAAFNRKRTRN